VRARTSPAVLVADPDSLMRWAIAQRFAGAGYILFEASEPVGAFVCLQAGPDAAIIDARLLHEGPGDLAPAIAAFSRSGRVVLTSSDSAHLVSSGVDGVDMDAAHILEKPFSLDALATIVTDSLNRRPSPR